jgi:hypothetical protein
MSLPGLKELLAVGAVLLIFFGLRQLGRLPQARRGQRRAASGDPGTNDSSSPKD